MNKQRASINYFSLLALLFALILPANAVLNAQDARRQTSPTTTATTQQQTVARPTVVTGPNGQQVDVNQIIRTMAQRETEFRRALGTYSFKRDLTFQTIGLGGQVSGEFRRVSNFTIDSQGVRNERITFAPMSTITELRMTSEDFEDFGGVNAFALESSKIDQYNFTYVGRERIDEIDTYVFDVAPRVIPRRVSERFFQGRIWIDDRDLQIVKDRGRGVPEGEQRFPIFETYREQIDGRFWFPTYVYADDVLEFESGQRVHIRMAIRFTDFQPSRGRLVIIEDDDSPPPSTTDEPTPAPSPSPTPSPRRP